MTEYYPIFLNLKNRLCVVIGGGKVAERKVLSLVKAGAKVKIISPEVTEALKKIIRDYNLQWEGRPYQEGDLKEAFLVISATNSPEVQKKVFQEAEARKIPCNVVDKPELCSFIVPSKVQRGDLLIAISTGGASPAVARRIREKLESFFGEEYTIYLILMRKIREKILESRLSPEEKERKLQTFALAPIPEYIKNGDFTFLITLLEKEGLSELIPELNILYKSSRDK
ncbi:siroheme synthase [Caldimicrobium thiodismutans]|uniref:precorrin-2 dehydrogenase n=1 Tax=Caldimicrobium thiodismutans TaxID=1653476 RepID=A0A0U4W155_9BACT|nr:bifunctional precorrin-2 dehydrogenase/sirohydrochlorin ferrochelatase [Caldimicrobium thiodismutans]BAU22891.1 siroheme synthase [Caldimicrobium thiodismutans]